MLLRQNSGHFSLICIVVHQELAFDTGGVKSQLSHAVPEPLFTSSLLLYFFLHTFSF